jgi:hypothetical protein
MGFSVACTIALCLADDLLRRDASSSTSVAAATIIVIVNRPQSAQHRFADAHGDIFRSRAESALRVSGPA